MFLLRSECSDFRSTPTYLGHCLMPSFQSSCLACLIFIFISNPHLIYLFILSFLSLLLSLLPSDVPQSPTLYHSWLNTPSRVFNCDDNDLKVFPFVVDLCSDIPYHLVPPPSADQHCACVHSLARMTGVMLSVSGTGVPDISLTLYLLLTVLLYS